MNPFDFIVVPFLLVALLQNTYPYASAAALGPVALRGFAARVLQGFRLGKTEWAIVACVGYWLASYFLAGGTLASLTDVLFWRRDGLLLITYPIFFLLLAWSLPARPLAAIWIGVLVILDVAALIGLAVSFNLPHPRFFEDLNLVAYAPGLSHEIFLAWYVAHNTTGGVYAQAALLALALLQERAGKRYQTHAWLLLLACMSGLAFTYSRGAYLGFVAGALFVLPLRKMGRTLKLGLMVALPVLIFVLTTSSVLDRIDTITDPYYGTNVARVTLWEEAVQDLRFSPLIGIGFSRYNDEFVTYKGIKGIVWVGVRGIVVNSDSHAHNSYLQFLAEGGIAGFLVTMSVWWFAWKELAFFERKCPESKLHWLHRAAKGCIVGVLVMSATEHMLGEGSVVLTLMAILGMTLAASRAELARMRSEEAQMPLPTSESPAPSLISA